MNAIVAIGGPALFEVVAAYRDAVPSEVWILGLKVPRDPNDSLFRSLEMLVEPFMSGYFEAEAQLQTEATIAHLASAPPAVPDLEPHLLSDAVASTLKQASAPAIALIEMLDRAHALQSIELVLTDDRTDAARTAMEWARARCVPAASVPDRTLLLPPPPRRCDRLFVTGDRAAQAYHAAGVRATPSVFAPASLMAPVDGAAEESRRAVARAALIRKSGWSAEDVVVVFEPPSPNRESALEPADSFAMSLAGMFAAFVAARADMPECRLAIIAPPFADSLSLTGRIAANAGVSVNDYAYAQSDHRVWIAGADIVVSIDSNRSIEAATYGIPAINLWRAENWYSGAAFSAEDGILDVAPANLGATLVVLGRNRALRAQIGAIACGRLADEFAGPAALRAIARNLAELRHPAEPRRGNAPPDIAIWAPEFEHSSGGIRALYRLCHLINVAGGNATIFPHKKVHPTWNTPARDTAFNDRTIVVIPEISIAHESLKRVVRWVLNVPGLIGGPKKYDAREMVFYYSQYFRAAAQSATAEVLSDERELMVHTIEPELFYNDRSRARLYDCVYIGKGQALFDRVQPREMRDTVVIRRAQTIWPVNRAETAALLRGCRRLYSFDRVTAIGYEAIICGAQLLLVQDDGSLEAAHYDLSTYVADYYDLSHVERFLRLVHERWDD